MIPILSSMRFRLVLLVLIAVLPAFGLILWSSLEERRNERAHAEDLAVQLTGAVAAQEEQVVQSARELLGRLAAAPQVVAGDTAACHDYLVSVHGIEPRYSGFGIANIDGDMHCTSVEGNPLVNVADRTYFHRVLESGQFAVGDYVLARDGAGTPVLPMAYPMFDEHGELAGMIASGITLDWLNEFSSRLTLPHDTTLIVLDRSGVVLARQPDPAAWVGKAVSDQPLALAVLSEGEGTATLTGLDHKERLYAFAPLGVAGTDDAYVAVGISTASAYAGINHTLERNMTLLAAVTVLALAAAWFGGGWFIVRGASALADVANRVQRGDLTARSGMRHGGGELGQIAGAFDEMADALQQRQAQRDRAEEELRASEERFRSYVEDSADGITMVDEDGRIVLFNSAAEQMLGYRRDELLGQSVEILVPESFRAGHPQHRAAFLTRASARLMGTGPDLRARRKDGTELPVAVSLTPLQTDQGVLVAVTVRDVSRAKQMEQLVQQTVAELRRSNAELEQFAYVASHDLQEPLRMVASYTQLLARRYEGKLDADADEFIAYAVDGAMRMQKLIQDLLTYSRVGTRGGDVQPVDSAEALAGALRNLRVAIGESGAEITHDPLPQVVADPQQLEQLLQNLIGNAIKFGGQAPPRIHVSAEQRGDACVFAVRDNGIGIDSQYAERIFIIFQRLHGKEAYPGTGIGLAVCKKIVERHGGRIWVESAPGEGATFRFTMPVAADQRAAA